MSDAARRKERYERALGIVEANTTPAQRPGLEAHALWRLLVENHGYSVAAARATVQAAVRNDDLYRYTDRAGEVRYIRGTEAALRRLIAAENQRDDPDRERIERIADRIQALQDSAHEP
jgi:hypothetical protein